MRTHATKQTALDSYCRPTLKGTALHDCDFVASDLTGLTMYGVRFDGVRMERGTLAHIRLSECMVHFWHLSAATLDTVRLTLCEAGRVASSGCTIAHLSILGGSYGYIELAGGTLSDLLVASANVATCQLLDIATSTRVRINESKLRALSLERCTVSDLYCWSSELLLVRLVEGAYEGSITECTLGAEGRIEDVELRSFFWDGSTVSDLTIARVRFQRFLSARAARFSGLRLEQVSFAPDFELDLEDASFEGGDRFSLPTRDEGAPR